MSTTPVNILQTVQTYQKAELAWLLNSFVGVNLANKKFKNFNDLTANLGDTVTFDTTPRYISYAGLVITEQQYDRTYGREPWKDGLRKALSDHFGEPIVDFEDYKPGDVALLKWSNNEQPSHVGIIANYKYGGLSLIHSYSLIAVTEHRIDSKWKNMIAEVYRPWLG